MYAIRSWTSRIVMTGVDWMRHKSHICTEQSRHKDIRRLLIYLTIDMIYLYFHNPRNCKSRALTLIQVFRMTSVSKCSSPRCRVLDY